jgi:hypothetical protein
MKRTVIAMAQDVPLDRENREPREIATSADKRRQPRWAATAARARPGPAAPRTRRAASSG